MAPPLAARKYAEILQCRAAFTKPPELGTDLPPIRVTFPDGVTVDGDHDEITARVGKLLGREVSLATLAAEHPGGEWDVRRFRPNILFDDGNQTGTNGEDAWIGQDLQIGAGPRVHVVASTPRCIMPTLGQGDLSRDPEILRTMARANRRPLGEFGLFAAAGAYAEVVSPGTVRVGDEVTVEPTTATGGPLANVMMAMASALQSQSAG